MVKIPITFHVKNMIEYLEDLLSQTDKGGVHLDSNVLLLSKEEEKEFLFQLLLILKEFETKGIENIEVAEVQKRLPQYGNIIETLADLIP